jgi:hypothetical protein
MVEHEHLGLLLLELVLHLVRPGVDSDGRVERDVHHASLYKRKPLSFKSASTQNDEKMKGSAYLRLVPLLRQEHEPRHTQVLHSCGGSNSSNLILSTRLALLRPPHERHGRIEDRYVRLSIALLRIRLLGHHLGELPVEFFVFLAGLGLGAGETLKDEVVFGFGLSGGFRAIGGEGSV